MPTLPEVLQRHPPADEHEARSLARIQAHVASGGDLFDRCRWDGHLTGSAFILDHTGQKLLLLFHRKLDRWLQPGGHGEPGEVEPLDVARREALEESGITGLTLHPTAPAPFDVDVHVIPARRDELAHEHLDIRYLFVAPADATLAPAEGESRQLAWVPLAEVAAVSDESVARAARKLLALAPRGLPLSRSCSQTRILPGYSGSMRSLLVSTFLACAAVCASTEAHADEAPARPYTLSATFSPIHLLLPVFEVSVEPYILPHFTMSAIAGYGSVKVSNAIGQSFKFSVLELGAQARGYLNASNDGLHLGVEALYIKVDTSDNSVGTVKVSGTGSGLAVGPLIGYKLLTRVGFTFEAQGGAQFGVVSAEAKASNGTTQAQDSDSESKVFPLLNLNIGWTF